MQSGVIGIGPRAHSSAHPSLPAAPVLPCTTLGETLRHAAHQLGQVAQLLAMCMLAIPERKAACTSGWKRQILSRREFAAFCYLKKRDHTTTNKPVYL